MTNTSVKFTVGGPVQAKSGTYLSRPADEHLLNACKASEFSYVLACRQIGKSSLMIETAKKLRQSGIRTAVIDLNKIGHTKEAESWYFSLLDALARALKLKIDVQSWWAGRERLTLIGRFAEFLYGVVLKEIPEPIVIFVDEIDMTLGLDFTDDFFAAIRSVYNDRAQCPAYNRMTFVLLGVATPDDLIQDNARTPFNIGQAITLRDFTKEECTPFRLEIEAQYTRYGNNYFNQAYDWTNGHPYLTQKLCYAILAPSQEEHPQLVETLVTELFLAPEGRHDINLQTVQKNVTSDSYALEMLRIYKRVIEDEEPVYDDERSAAINRLKLYGLVIARNDRLRARNKIYAQIFDTSWVDQALVSKRLILPTGLPSKYKVLQEIGQGGFSTVYLAQFRDADRTQSVALKVLKAHNASDSNLVKRFKQEARAVAKLEHPNIIHILDTGGDEDTFYITMEYIPGGTLRDRLKTSPLPRDEAIRIIKDIGSALAYAHERGIIHRDVNPNNILLDDRQDPLRPVLSDFGLIKVLSGDDDMPIQSSTILGTLDYMAPEQLRQKAPTPATDVYALAITFYEMVSGRRPFAAISPLDIMDKHANEPLPPLSRAEPEVGAFFDDILLRATAKDPSERFNEVTDFIEALEAANAQAKEAERHEQENKAATTVEAARGYIQKGRYDPNKALIMVEAALEMCPRYLDALRLKGKIQLQQEQIEMALESYKQAYEQVKNPSSDIGIEYLETLSQVAEMYWQRRMYQEAVEYYEVVKRVLNGKDYTTMPIQGIWQRARARLIEFHHHAGEAAYASGNPQDIDNAISVLDYNLEALHALRANSESEDLGNKTKLLRMRKYQNIIKDAQSAINAINITDSHVRFSGEDIFQHYLVMDRAFQALIEVEPENKQWQQERHRKLKERAEGNLLFALRASKKLEPDYEASLRHYKAILDIEQTAYPGLAQELNLNLPEKIAELQTKADHDGKYNEIRKLMENKDYPKALERLSQEFIREGNYEHRDVAKLLWGLVYAKQHEGNLPPEWESLLSFEFLSKRLIQVERVQTQQVKDKLEPWSQPKILETVDRENGILRSYEDQIKSIEAMLCETREHIVTETPDIQACCEELTKVRTQIQEQRNMFFQINVNEIAQKVGTWLQRIKEIETLIQTGNPVKDIPEFLNRIDQERQTIEKDPTFEKLHLLITANFQICQKISEMRPEIHELLAKASIDSIKKRNEESLKVQHELAQTQKEMADLQQYVNLPKQQFEKTSRQHQIDRYLIPVSLVLALVAGGIIAPQAQFLAELPVIKWAALLLLFVYLLYYVWTYYVAQVPSDDL